MLIFSKKKNNNKTLPFINLSVQLSFMEHLVLGGQRLFTMMYKKHNSFPQGDNSAMKARER